MSRKRTATPGFTLLELVVVLAILAVVTTLAVRSLDGVEDQRRFEAAQRSLQEIADAVLGSPNDRAPDGTLIASGFLADMGRLPRTSGLPELSLRELWENPDVPFDIRQATAANGVPAEHADDQVLVPGGWRGPYLRLPIGATTLLDAWGNAITSPLALTPPNPDTTGYARLRDAADGPITVPNQDIRIIRVLGANGRRDAADSAYDRDLAIAFVDDQIRASVAGQVEVREGEMPATPQPGQQITVRVFGPSPANPAQVAVTSLSVSFAQNPVTFTIPPASAITPGPRVIRAYLQADAAPAAAAALKRSTVRQVALRPGANFIDLTIDR